MQAGRRRLGVLGGSFNPPHLGHLVVASVAYGQLGLDGVLFVPSAVPPHKVVDDSTPAALRLALTKAATAGDTRFAVSTVEIDLGLAYTCDVLAALRQRHADADLVFLMGSDSLLQFESWREPEAILRQARLGVARRPGDDAADVAAAAARWGEDRVELLDMPAMGISSTDIRRRAGAGLPIRYLVPSAVEDLIRRHDLFARA
jgi:nicotinate-nucleotide adenylyltransferase